MDFEQNGYTEDEILSMLMASNRKVWYEYTLTSTDGVIHNVSIVDGTVTFDSTADVMRTFSGHMRKDDYFNVDIVEANLKPWLCLETTRKESIKWALGNFIISGDSDCEAGEEIINITGYDMSKKALDEGMVSRTYFPVNTVYTSAISQLLGEAYSTYEVKDALQKMENAVEWEIGDSRLSIINTLLASINYNPLYFDEYGDGKCTPFVFPKMREVDITYSTDNKSIIKDGITKKSNKFEVPNKFVRYTEDADAAYYISTYTNDDSNDPYSTVNRGRVITDIASVDEIASQSDLDSYVRKIAQEKRQAVDEIEIKTLNMPCHGFQNCIFLSCDLYGIAGKYIETGWEMELAVGGTMTHRLQKASEL